jgi:hypothetical protein
MSYVMRHGKRIEVETVNPDTPSPKKSRRTFKAQWVKLPRHWISALGQSKSANTYRLALLILLAAFEDKSGNGEIILSAKVVTGMSRWSKTRAARELVELGLITIKENGVRALRAKIVSHSYYQREVREKKE